VNKPSSPATISNPPQAYINESCAGRDHDMFCGCTVPRRTLKQNLFAVIYGIGVFIDKSSYVILYSFLYSLAISFFATIPVGVVFLYVIQYENYTMGGEELLVMVTGGFALIIGLMFSVAFLEQHRFQIESKWIKFSTYIKTEAGIQ
jgi:hypothetical protein